MKKLSSVILTAVLLTSAILLFQPQAKAVFKPEIFVSPAQNKFWAPCIVSTEFDISVKIWNQEEETGEAIYAFDFWLYWFNSTYGFPGGSITQPMVTLEKIEVKPPWNEGEYFIIKNETNFNEKTGKWEGVLETITFTDPFTGNTYSYNNYWNYYHLAITALDKAPPLTDVKIPVVDLTFHIDDEPLYGFDGSVYNPKCSGWYSPFALVDTKMSGIDPITNEPYPIDHIPEDGAYWILAKQPKIWLSTEKPWDEDLDGDVDFYYVVKWTNCTWFTVEVNVKDVGKMYSFEFVLYFNATLLNTDLQHIHIKEFLPPPYETLIQDIVLPSNPWENWAYVYMKAVRPCNKPPVCGAGAIVNIDFHTKCPTESDGGTPPKPVYILPTSVKSLIWFGWARIDSKWVTPDGAGGTVNYDWPGGLLMGPPQLPSIYGPVTHYNFVEYYFKPRRQDLNQDGHVDIADLTAIAKQYGKPLTNPYAIAFTKLADPTTEPVDLFDVVYVAKYFCKPYTPLDPYTGLPYDP